MWPTFHVVLNTPPSYLPIPLWKPSYKDVLSTVAEILRTTTPLNLPIPLWGAYL